MDLQLYKSVILFQLKMIQYGVIKSFIMEMKICKANMQHYGDATYSSKTA
jgi:hypothetical protein